jgi:hypothetical protein
VVTNKGDVVTVNNVDYELIVRATTLAHRIDSDRTENVSPIVQITVTQTPLDSARKVALEALDLGPS